MTQENYGDKTSGLQFQNVPFNEGVPTERALRCADAIQRIKNYQMQLGGVAQYYIEMNNQALYEETKSINDMCDLIIEALELMAKERSDDKEKTNG